jgi:hypothetical protein
MKYTAERGVERQDGAHRLQLRINGVDKARAHTLARTEFPVLPVHSVHCDGDDGKKDSLDEWKVEAAPRTQVHAAAHSLVQQGVEHASVGAAAHEAGDGVPERRGDETVSKVRHLLHVREGERPGEGAAAAGDGVVGEDVIENVPIVLHVRRVAEQIVLQRIVENVGAEATEHASRVHDANVDADEADEADGFADKRDGCECDGFGQHSARQRRRCDRADATRRDEIVTTHSVGGDNGDERDGPANFHLKQRRQARQRLQRRLRLQRRRRGVTDGGGGHVLNDVRGDDAAEQGRSHDADDDDSDGGGPRGEQHEKETHGEVRRRRHRRRRLCRRQRLLQLRTQVSVRQHSTGGPPQIGKTMLLAGGSCDDLIKIGVRRSVRFNARRRRVTRRLCIRLCGGCNQLPERPHHLALTQLFQPVEALHTSHLDRVRLLFRLLRQGAHQLRVRLLNKHTAWWRRRRQRRQRQRLVGDRIDAGGVGGQDDVLVSSRLVVVVAVRTSNKIPQTVVICLFIAIAFNIVVIIVAAENETHIVVVVIVTIVVAAVVDDVIKRRRRIDLLIVDDARVAVTVTITRVTIIVVVDNIVIIGDNDGTVVDSTITVANCLANAASTASNQLVEVDSFNNATGAVAHCLAQRGWRHMVATRANAADDFAVGIAEHDNFDVP